MLETAQEYTPRHAPPRSDVSLQIAKRYLIEANAVALDTYLNDG